MTPTKQNKKTNYISLAVMLLIIGLTLYLIFRDYSPALILSKMKENNLLYIALAFLLMLVYVMLEGVSLRTITRSFGEQTTFKKGLVYGAVDLYFSAITPSSEGGQPMMVYTMTRDGISISRSTITAILFTNMFTSGLLICTGIALLISPSLLFTESLLFRICLIFGLVVSFLLFAGCILLLRFGHTMKKLGVKLIGFCRKIRLIKNEEKALTKLDDSVADFAACSAYIKEHPFMTVKVLFFATLQRVVYFSVPYLIYLSFGFTDCSYFEVFAIQVLMQMAVYSIPIPGAAGITETMMQLLYLNIYPAEDIAVTAMLLVRAVTFYFTVLFCGGVTLTDSILHKRKKRKESLSL